MLKYFYALSAFMIFWAPASPLYAANLAGSEVKACYSAREAEAEQGIRIHSELMVIGLNCQHMARGGGNQNLYLSYRDFTSRHKRLFQDYERLLLNYFERGGASNPEAALNTLRTSFANKISTDAAQMRPDMFCKRYAPRIIKVEDMDHEGLRKWASTFFPSHPVSRPICQ